MGSTGLLTMHTHMPSHAMTHTPSHAMTHLPSHVHDSHAFTSHDTHTFTCHDTHAFTCHDPHAFTCHDTHVFTCYDMHAFTWPRHACLHMSWCTWLHMAMNNTNLQEKIEPVVSPLCLWPPHFQLQPTMSQTHWQWLILSSYNVHQGLPGLR